MMNNQPEQTIVISRLAPATVSAPPPQAKPIGKGWSRGQVTVKLTPRRKSLLCDIALGMPNGTTPSDAIDRALEAAWCSRDELASLEGRVDSLEQSVQAASGERRQEADKIVQSLSGLALNIARLNRLIEESATPP